MKIVVSLEKPNKGQKRILDEKEIWKFEEETMSILDNTSFAQLKDLYFENYK